jgi:hypothetical protein
MANCDEVVPNAFGLVYASNIYGLNDPTAPLPAAPAFFTTGGLRGAFQLFIGAAFGTSADTAFGKCPAPPPATQPNPTPSVSHGFLTDWSIPSLTLNAQNDAAAFLMSDTLPLVLQHQ